MPEWIAEHGQERWSTFDPDDFIIFITMAGLPPIHVEELSLLVDDPDGFEIEEIQQDLGRLRPNQ
jgi:hypothetical protein